MLVSFFGMMKKSNLMPDTLEGFNVNKQEAMCHSGGVGNNPSYLDKNNSV